METVIKTDTAQNKRIWLFLALAFVPAWAAILVMYLTGVPYGGVLSTIVLTGIMFLPALASILTRAFTKEGFQGMLLNPNFHGKWVWPYLAAFFGPLALILAGGALYFLLLPGQLDTSLTTLKALIAQNPVGMTPTLLLALQLGQAALIGPVINLIPALGEELGWRGYLLPKLSRRMGTGKAILASGAIWGVWHAPMIAMGHNYGTAYLGYPWLGILLMTLFCVLFGAFLSWLTVRSRSVIPAAMAHSALNASAALPALVCAAGFDPRLGPYLMGAVPMLAVLAVAIPCLMACRGKAIDPPAAKQPEAQARG